VAEKRSVIAKRVGIFRQTPIVNDLQKKLGNALPKPTNHQTAPKNRKKKNAFSLENGK
jgi:hypothetical protein